MPQGRGGRGISGGAYSMPSVMDAMAEVVQILSQAKLLPDAPAYMPLIQALETAVIQIVDTMRKKSAAQMAGAQPPGGGGPAPGMGGPPGMGPPGMGGPQGPGAGGPGGPGGEPNQIAPGGGPGMAGFGTPNPDELRRTLAGPAAVGGMS